MSFFSILYTILISPLQLIFEIIFVIANRIIGHPALAIIALSLAMNFLVLPLYRRADAMQEEARDLDNKLSRGVKHIKATFSGDEKMMMLQTYYRQNNYSPVNGLKGSVSLLLEIPFFIAAYQFLSHLMELEGVSFGPISNLAAPDALLNIARFSVNLLPILMTAINLVSSAIFLKGFPLKSKIQLYGMALFFLVFLYNSPAGLVFYWTLNNLFSLVKTIFYKLKNPKKVLSILFSVVGIVLLLFAAFVYEKSFVKRRVFMMLLGFAMQLPALSALFKHRLPSFSRSISTSDNKLFSICSCFIAVLTGLLIPSAVIASSPLEFLGANLYNPLLYLVHSCCLAIGTFIVWFRIFYGLSGPKGKILFSRIMAIACIAMIVNYMFFGTDLGVLSSSLKYESPILGFSTKESLFNLSILVALAVVIYIFVVKKEKLFRHLALTMMIALVGMSFWNIGNISKTVSQFKQQSISASGELPEFKLSKDGKNVLILMLDRGMAEYVPYIFNEKPELQQQFDGFTYFSNVISYGAHTNFGTPPLFGGYEYTPVEMNLRNDELLVEKHNEAIKVLPVLFEQNGFEVSVCDIPYANYSEISDYSIYSDYPDIQCYTATGKFTDADAVNARINANKRNFFCFSIMKSLPLCIQDTLYQSGNYNQSAAVHLTQIVNNMYSSSGTDLKFMDSYNVLASLPDITTVKDSGNTFLMMSNNLTHEPMLLQEPYYEPALIVNNYEYYSDLSRFTVNGKTISMENFEQVSHYQTNMAAMLQLGKWFDYMRENDVYDNTRIILAADHGGGLYHTPDLYLDYEVGSITTEAFYPLLMFKDFGATGFSGSEEFMTNADVPTMAVDKVISDPVNPFTGKLIDNSAKTSSRQFILGSDAFSISSNNGYSFMPSSWYSVSDNIWEKDNWQYHPTVGIFPDALNQ